MKSDLGNFNLHNRGSRVAIYHYGETCGWPGNWEGVKNSVWDILIFGNL